MTVTAEPDHIALEKRKLPRKMGMLTGVLVDTNGEDPADCTIRDVNILGVAVTHPKKLPVGMQIYLLDTGSHAAYLTRVVWNGPGRSGLLFVRRYAMGLGLPYRLKFLWRLLLEAKLRQAERAIASGVNSELAFSSVGLTREQVHRMAPYSHADLNFQRLLRRTISLLDGVAVPRRSPRALGGDKVVNQRG
jgi:hypothetical protein